MKKLRSFFVLLVVQFLVLFPASSDSYFITEEQLMELENQSNEQKELIQKQKKQLEILNSQCLTQEIQLISLKEQTSDLENQLNQAETSLKKSKTKSWIEKFFIAIAGIFGGFLFGIFIPGMIN